MSRGVNEERPGTCSHWSIIGNGILYDLGVIGYRHAARGMSLLAGSLFTSRVPPHLVALRLLVIGIISGFEFMWDVRHSEAG